MLVFVDNSIHNFAKLVTVEENESIFFSHIIDIRNTGICLRILNFIIYLIVNQKSEKLSLTPK